jgi:hypothetical protein
MNTELLSLSPKDFCRETHACREGAKYATGFSTMAEVWEACPRADWLVWMLNALDAPQDPKVCRLYMVWCARHTPLANGATTGSLLTDSRSHEALDAAVAFTEGEIGETELEAAWSAAWSAAGSAARLAAESAAWSAAWSAAGSAARLAAESAAWSAARSAAWSAAESAAWSAAWSAARSAQANQFRRVVNNPFKGL